MTAASCAASKAAASFAGNGLVPVLTPAEARSKRARMMAEEGQKFDPFASPAADSQSAKWQPTHHHAVSKGSKDAEKKDGGVKDSKKKSRGA